LEAETVTELLSAENLREVREGSTIAFRHDVLRDWTLGFLFDEEEIRSRDVAAANTAGAAALGAGLPAFAESRTSIAGLPPSAWRTVNLEVPHHKYRTPRVFEQKACPRQRTFRQFFITELGYDEPTILLTNDKRATAAQLITRYAKRMLIENGLADVLRFFHMTHCRLRSP
jgi:Transposase DDE domain